MTLTGTVERRFRNAVGENEVIRYKVLADGYLYTLEHWNPDGVEPFSIGQHVEVAVTAAAYKSKSGAAIVSLRVKGAQRGEF